METYADYKNWIEIQSKKLGKNVFLSSVEYKAAHSTILQLYKKEKKEAHNKLVLEARLSMAEVGAKFGDIVLWDRIDSFFNVHTISGAIVNKNGLPYVGKYLWHKGFICVSK